MAWGMARTRHRSRASGRAGGCISASIRFYIRPTVSGLVLPNEQKPKWELILSYEQEIRKRAYQWVRRGDVATLEEGMLVLRS